MLPAARVHILFNVLRLGFPDKRHFSMNASFAAAEKRPSLMFTRRLELRPQAAELQGR